jgi:predicted anti-sigma-YlaC factor YlaD
MSCQELVELVTDYLDGALAPQVVQRLTEHVQNCHACAEYIVQVSTTVRLSAATAAAELEQSPDRDALLAAFRDFQRGA